MKVLWVLVLSFLCTSSVLAIEDMGTPVTFQDAATATGSGTAMRVRGYVSVGVQVTISGTSATVTFQGSSDGSTYDTVSCTATNGGLNTGTATATGLYQCNIGSLSYFRANITACSSCTVTVTGQPSTAVASISSSRATASMNSTGGVPTSGVLNGNGGFAPPDMDGSYASRGCTIKMAGGNMGNTSYTGSNFLMACDIEDSTGRFFTIWNNDSSSLPKTLFEVRRNGFTYANGFSVQQTQSYNAPTYYTAQGFAYGSSVGVWAPLNATTDVSEAHTPVLGLYGMVSGYGNTYPPLMRSYGQAFKRLSVGYTHGINVQSLEDNGNAFTNQLTRTTAAYTNATTTLGIVSTTGGSGALVAPVMNARTYAFTGKIYFSTSSTGGIKLGINSSTTASAIVYQVNCWSNTGTALLLASQVTSVGSSAGVDSAGAITGFCTIDGTLTMSGGTNTAITMDCANASAVCTTASTAGLTAAKAYLIYQEADDACFAIASNTYMVSFVANTSVTMSRNALCNPASISYNFLDTIWVEAADNSAAGTLTIAQGSSFEVKGSINGGSY